MKSKLLLGAVVTFGLQSHICVAKEADEDRIPINVVAQCDNDSVGSRLAYRVREQLRASKLMYLNDEYTDSALQLQVVCVAPSADDRNLASRYAWAITYVNYEGTLDYLVNFGVGSCGTEKLSSCAETLVSQVDESISHVVKLIKDKKIKFVEK